MPYIKEVCVAGKTIEVSKYYSPRWHCKGERREKQGGVTTEAQKRVNQKRAIKKLRRLMNANFVDGDLLVRLDFSQRPTGSEEMQTLMAKAIRKMRNQFLKSGQELKYIYVKEVGSKGGRHIHMMMNKCDTDLLRKCWTYGGIHIDPLYTDGQYAKIAEYFVKYAVKTEDTEGMLVGKRWYASRNLIKPRIDKKVISANKFKKEIKEVKGYLVDKESIQSGISEVTGYEYYTYTLIKTDKRGEG